MIITVPGESYSSIVSCATKLDIYVFANNNSNFPEVCFIENKKGYPVIYHGLY